jgi:hypothetical protein
LSADIIGLSRIQDDRGAGQAHAPDFSALLGLVIVVTSAQTLLLRFLAAIVSPAFIDPSAVIDARHIINPIMAMGCDLNILRCGSEDEECEYFECHGLTLQVASPCFRNIQPRVESRILSE